MGLIIHRGLGRAYRDNVALMPVSVSFQACQQDAQRHLMAIGAVQRIGPILGPAGLSIVSAQHCRAIFILSTLVARSKLQTVIRDRAVLVCFIGLPYRACPSSRLCREAAKSLLTQFAHQQRVATAHFLQDSADISAVP